ncbi:hypothetical protein BGZ51_007178 [Haplosporangium sp. Z 767]|nr:hypothetical protein BGZ51_007178 [Haplosporangium sp. Z 767]
MRDNLLDNEEFDLEPCSMWVSLMHAALHYARLALDLAPFGQETQISVHAAPGVASAGDSVVLNAWTAPEQNLAKISSQLQALQQQDVAYKDKAGNDRSKDITLTSNVWIEQALKGAIAHILEPAFATQVEANLQRRTILHTKMNTIIMVLVDPEEQPKEQQEDIDEDMSTRSDTSHGSPKSWKYDKFDLREILASALEALKDFIKNSKRDVVREEISRTCTASIYTVLAEDELSATKALTNHYLQRNKDIQIFRIHNLPLENNEGTTPIELFCRTDHIKALASQKRENGAHTQCISILHDTPPTFRDVMELSYGIECTKESYALPTRCAHLATISPFTFVSSFSTLVKGRVHLLKDKHGSEDMAVMALFDHDGQLYVHCLQTSGSPADSSIQTVSPSASTSKRKTGAQISSAYVKDFVDVVIRPNTISSNTSSFPQENNAFTEITPSALKPTVTLPSTGDGDIRLGVGEERSSKGVNMAMPAHEAQIKRFRSAICKSKVDAAGISTIQSVLDSLIVDARPPVQHGDSSGAPPPPAQSLPFREGAQAVLADLWMIGQRFKTVSPSHAQAAKLIADKVSPKGMDHITVRLALVPPSMRADLFNELTTGNTGADTVNSGSREGPNQGFGGGRQAPGFSGRNKRGFANRRGPGNILAKGNQAGNSNDTTLNANEDIMVSLTGKTQPVPYLETHPQTREEIEESEREYLASMGEDGCLLKAFWGSRGAQGSSVAAVLNSVTSLDSPSITGIASAASAPAFNGPHDALAAHQRIKKPMVKRLRLQDFAGRTPVSESGGHKNK